MKPVENNQITFFISKLTCFFINSFVVKGRFSLSFELRLSNVLCTYVIYAFLIGCTLLTRAV